MHKISKIGINVIRCLNKNSKINQRNVIVLKKLNVRHNHNVKNAEQNELSKIKTKVNFNEFISARRSEAQRSILVQVNSEKSFSELYSYCSQFGDIEGAHHFTQDELHYILLEYVSGTAAKAAISTSVCNGDIDGIYVQSSFLWFRAGPKIQSSTNLTANNRELNIVDGNRTVTDAELTTLLQHAETLDDQLVILHRSTCLNDIGTRLRFMAARQIEESLWGMFPMAKAQPFGSSVNGFGKLGCDLDLILRLTDDNIKNDPSQRLVFHSKETLSNGRSQMQRYMENLSDMLQLFLPGVCHVRRILQARVPIIKYHHEHLDLEVDLSMSNMSGFYMSELFYMFGQIDSRVQPLVFAVRKWAQSIGLTNPSPGRWITNFSLTCLVIGYLQQLDQPILPTINALVQQARPEDRKILEHNLNCTFLRDLHKLSFVTSNETPLHQLFVGFFEFYSQFEFSDFAICLNNAKSHTKPDHSAMYIVNPLEIELNVSKNVSVEECERFRIEVRNAAWILESNFAKEHSNEKPWGLMSLIKSGQQSATIRPNMFFKARMVDVSDLFSETDPNQMNTTQIHYKNDAVKKEIGKIRKRSQTDVHTLREDNFKQQNNSRIRKR